MRGRAAKEHGKVYHKNQFDETNRWTLFPEENKKSDNGPDYTGEVDIGGTKYRLAGWKRVSKKSGKKFLSGAIEPKDGKNEKQIKTAAPSNNDFEI
jgi:uncharacterized protein (DUF736 family)